jgi:cytochrome c
MMKSTMKVTAALLACAAIIAGSALAAERATKDEAQAMVKKAIAFIKAQGPAKAYAEIINKSGQFTDRDLYIVVYGLDGTVLAHGANEKLVGQNLIGQTDVVGGKSFVKERVELAKKGQPFWQEYKFLDPLTKQIADKEMYCEKLDETAVCGGVYKLWSRAVEAAASGPSQSKRRPDWFGAYAILLPLTFSVSPTSAIEEAFRGSPGSQGSLGIFSCNGLVSSIMALGLIALFWPLIQTGWTRLRTATAA